MCVTQTTKTTDVTSSKLTTLEHVSFSAKGDVREREWKFEGKAAKWHRQYHIYQQWKRIRNLTFLQGSSRCISAFCTGTCMSHTRS